MRQIIQAYIISVSVLVFVASCTVAAEQPKTENGYTNIAGEATSVRQERTKNNQGLALAIIASLFILGGIGFFARQLFRNPEED